MIETLPLIWAFATLFVVMDPIGLAPIFVALTQGIEPTKRKAIGLRACVIAFVILALFGFFGDAVLGFAGISMPAFQIAGGALLFLTAMEMLFELRAKRRSTKGDELDDDDRDPSVFPLATPLIAGPGAIASIILLTNEAQGNLLQQISVIVVMGAVVLDDLYPLHARRIYGARLGANRNFGGQPGLGHAIGGAGGAIYLKRIAGL